MCTSLKQLAVGRWRRTVRRPGYFSVGFISPSLNIWKRDESARGSTNLNDSIAERQHDCGFSSAGANIGFFIKFGCTAGCASGCILSTHLYQKYIRVVLMVTNPQLDEIYLILSVRVLQIVKFVHFL